MSRYEPTKHEYVFLDANSGKFYFRGTVKGAFIDKSLKTDKITVAKIRADALRAGDDPEALRNRSLVHSWTELFDMVMTIQKSKSKKTGSSAKTHIEGHLRPWFKENCKTLGQFEASYEEIWAGYKLHRDVVTPGRKLKHDREHLVICLHRAYKKGWIKRKFSRDDFFLNEAKTPIGKYLEDDQVRAIVRGMKEYPKDLLQFLMAVTMGMRRSEILGLELSEIDLKNREINLDPNFIKTRRPRKVPIPISDDVFPMLSGAVERCLAAKGRYVFPKWYTNEPGQPLNWFEHQEDNRYHWDLIRARTKINVRFHDTRHTAIANMLQGGVPISTVSKVVGATEEVVVRVYDKVSKKINVQVRSLFCGRFVENEDTDAKVS